MSVSHICYWTILTTILVHNPSSQHACGEEGLLYSDQDAPQGRIGSKASLDIQSSQCTSDGLRHTSNVRYNYSDLEFKILFVVAMCCEDYILAVLAVLLWVSILMQGVDNLCSPMQIIRSKSAICAAFVVQL